MWNRWFQLGYNVPKRQENICRRRRFAWSGTDPQKGLSRIEWLPEMGLIDTAAESTTRSASSVLCLLAEIKVSTRLRKWGKKMHTK